jgi:hypothetical protein
VSRDSRRSADVGRAIRSRVPGSRPFPRRLRDRRDPHGRCISSFPGSRLPTELPGTKKPAEMLGRDIVPAFPLPTGAGGIAGNDTPRLRDRGCRLEPRRRQKPWRLSLAHAPVRPAVSPAESCPDRSQAFPPTLAWRSRPVADLCAAPPMPAAGPLRFSARASEAWPESPAGPTEHRSAWPVCLLPGPSWPRSVPAGPSRRQGAMPAGGARGFSSGRPFRCSPYEDAD